MNLNYLTLTTKPLTWIFLLFFSISALSAQPVIGTTTFDGTNSNIASYDLLPRSGTVQGWSFFVDGEGSGSINHNGGNTPSTVTIFAQQALTLNIASEDGNEFDLDSIIIQWFSFSGNFTMTSYRDGSSIGSVVLNATSSFSDYDLSNNDDFKNIDEIRMDGFSNSNITAIIDEIRISTATLSFETIENDRNLSIYPNPSSNFITVKNIDTRIDYHVMDLNGTIIMKGEINQNNDKINLKKLTSGLYLLKLGYQNPIKIMKK
ncbi:T9SS type A sorting domain-containing protein [Flavobacterium sp. J27]|uniref:T9SS type A sorting domain-containing protein n=1 Tax=Flavobacterium sp. J27 TaxID=2060419 RepID=UPI00102FB7DC|nr:T9SS type A sorting domain-containing protein [Flavobacterium sp. J27]